MTPNTTTAADAITVEPAHLRGLVATGPGHALMWDGQDVLIGPAAMADDGILLEITTQEEIAATLANDARPGVPCTLAIIADSVTETARQRLEDRRPIELQMSVSGPYSAALRPLRHPPRSAQLPPLRHRGRRHPLPDPRRGHRHPGHPLLPRLTGPHHHRHHPPRHRRARPRHPPDTGTRLHRHRPAPHPARRRRRPDRHRRRTHPPHHRHLPPPQRHRFPRRPGAA